MLELGRLHDRQTLVKEVRAIRFPMAMERGVVAIAGLLATHAWMRASSWEVMREIDHLSLDKLGDPDSYVVFRENAQDLTAAQVKSLLALLVRSGFPSCIIQRITGRSRKTIAAYAAEAQVRLPNWRWGRARTERVRFGKRVRGTD